MQSSVKSGPSDGLCVLQMRKHLELFRDEAAYTEFVDVIESVAEPGTIAIVLDDERPICGVVSMQEAQDAMRSRLVARLVNDPDALDAIRKKLADEQSVEYGTFE